MPLYRFMVEGEEAGSRVDEFLSRRLPLLSHTKLRALVGAGAAARGGTVLSIGRRLAAGEAIEFEWNPESVPGCPPEAMPLEILREDSELVAVNKPSGMLVHPTRGVKRGTLTNGLLAHLNPGLNGKEFVREAGAPALWPRFIHRLDRDTSGVILAAKTRESAGILGRALAAGQISKAYLAIVNGELTDKLYEIREPIRRFEEGPPYWRASADGQAALSTVEAVATQEGLSLVRMRPVTGRTNQLRIHAAAMGTPILGDASYGGSPAGGLMLHAWRIDFRHPGNGERVTITAPIPERFREAWPGIGMLIETGESGEADEAPGGGSAASPGKRSS